MTKSIRLFKLLTLLQGCRRAITASAIAEQLGISERTVYRDIEALVATGAPISGEAGVGFLLQKGSTLAPLMFDQEELEALILGVRMVRGWGDPALGEAADNALSKIRAVLPDQMHYLRDISEEILLVPEYERAELLNNSPALRVAIREREKVKIDYSKLEQDEQTSRIIWPLGLVYWGKVWTLISWCEMRDDYRVFRLDRIMGLQRTNEYFEPTPERGLKHYLDNRFEC